MPNSQIEAPASLDNGQPFRPFQGTDHPLFLGTNDVSGGSSFAGQKETLAQAGKEMERANLLPSFNFDDILGWFADEPKQGNGIIARLPMPGDPVNPADLVPYTPPSAEEKPAPEEKKPRPEPQKPYSICDNVPFAMGSPEICGW